MKTYVTVTISSDGAKASEVFSQFEAHGFKTSMGAHDLVYEWKDKSVRPEQVIELVDKVQAKLEGTNVRMHFVTV